MHARLALVEFLNEEVRALAAADERASPAARRRRLLAAVSGRYAFPMRASVRGYVVGARDVEGVPAEALKSAADAGRAASGRYLEVVPEGFTREAFEALGPLLVPLSRGLDSGSVLALDVEILDPSAYEMQPPGLITRLESVRIEVAVEP